MIVFRWNVAPFFLWQLFNYKEEQQGNIIWNKELPGKKVTIFWTFFIIDLLHCLVKPFMNASWNVTNVLANEKNVEWEQNCLFYGFLLTAEKHLRFDELLNQPENYFWKKWNNGIFPFWLRFMYLVSTLHMCKGLSTF